VIFKNNSEDLFSGWGTVASEPEKLSSLPSFINKKVKLKKKVFIKVKRFTPKVIKFSEV